MSLLKFDGFISDILSQTKLETKNNNIDIYASYFLFSKCLTLSSNGILFDLWSILNILYGFGQYLVIERSITYFYPHPPVRVDIVPPCVFIYFVVVLVVFIGDLF